MEIDGTYQQFHFPVNNLIQSGFSFHPDKHQGWDIKSSVNDTRVYAMTDSQVRSIFYDKNGGWIIRLKSCYIDNRWLEIDYGHLVEDSWEGLYVGQVVTAGQQFARYGTSGMAFGAHCHLRIKEDGKDVDPFYQVNDMAKVYKVRKDYIDLITGFGEKEPSKESIQNWVNAGENIYTETQRLVKQYKCKI